MIAPFLIALLAASAQAPVVPAEGATAEDLGGGRLRITISHRGADQRQFLGLIAELEEAADRACQGRGAAVATSALQFDAYPNKRWAVTQTFTCEAPSGQ